MKPTNTLHGMVEGSQEQSANSSAVRELNNLACINDALEYPRLVRHRLCLCALPPWESTNAHSRHYSLYSTGQRETVNESIVVLGDELRCRGAPCHSCSFIGSVVGHALS